MKRQVLSRVVADAWDSAPVHADRVLEFYGLHEQPFGVTPNYRRMYPSRTHRHALKRLANAVLSDLGFSLLIAEPGMGKTTLIFKLMTQLRDAALFALVFQTQCNSREFLRALLSDLKLPLSDDVASMYESLNELVLREAPHRRVVVVVDEAHNLEPEVVETLRLLSNFETANRKLLHIILTAQPQLADKLARPDLAQAQQRIQTIARLLPFTAQETIQCIQYRLREAGFAHGSLFTDSAYRKIAQASQGIPRKINRICFHALAAGCELRKTQIDEEIVNGVLAEFDFGLLRRSCSEAFANGATHQLLEPPEDELSWESELPDSLPDRAHSTLSWPLSHGPEEWGNMESGKPGMSPTEQDGQSPFEVLTPAYPEDSDEGHNGQRPARWPFVPEESERQMAETALAPEREAANRSVAEVPAGAEIPFPTTPFGEGQGSALEIEELPGWRDSADGFYETKNGEWPASAAVRQGPQCDDPTRREPELAAEIAEQPAEHLSDEGTALAANQWNAQIPLSGFTEGANWRRANAAFDEATDEGWQEPTHAETDRLAEAVPEIPDRLAARRDSYQEPELGEPLEYADYTETRGLISEIPGPANPEIQNELLSEVQPVHSSRRLRPVRTVMIFLLAVAAVPSLWVGRQHLSSIQQWIAADLIPSGKKMLVVCHTQLDHMRRQLEDISRQVHRLVPSQAGASVVRGTPLLAGIPDAQASNPATAPAAIPVPHDAAAPSVPVEEPAQELPQSTSTNARVGPSTPASVAKPMPKLANAQVTVSAEAPGPARLSDAEGAGQYQAGSLIHQVRPEYPLVAVRSGAQGEILLRAQIGTNGHVVSVRPISISIGPTSSNGDIISLVKAATNAISKWRYDPAQVNGRPIGTVADVRVSFKLRETEIPPVQ